MDAQEEKRLKKNAYSLGYAAGQKSIRKTPRKIEISVGQVPLVEAVIQHTPRMTDAQFYDAAFLAVLKLCLEQDGWSINGKKAHTTEDRMRLAASFAKDALKQRKRERI